MVEGDGHHESADGLGRVPRRWPWIAGTAAGLIIGFVAWNVMSLAIWFSSGGTFGGFGGAADQYVDWSRLEILHAWWTWVPAVTAGAVPTAWAWWSLERAPRESRNRARLRLAGILGIVVVAATSPALLVLFGRSKARGVDDVVTLALERATDGKVERSIEKPGEDDPWMETLRSLRPTSPEALAAHTSADSGTWWCFERGGDQWFFEPASGGTWVSVDGEDAKVVVRPQVMRLERRANRLEPCAG